MFKISLIFIKKQKSYQKFSIAPFIIVYPLNIQGMYNFKNLRYEFIQKKTKVNFVLQDKNLTIMFKIEIRLSNMKLKKLIF